VKEEKFSETSYKNIIVTGFRFVSVAIAAAIVWNTDNFVVSHYLGIASVTPFSINFKLYLVLFSIIMSINSSLMPLMGKEIGHHNWDWINNTYKKFLVIMAMIGGLAWLGGALFYRDILHLWIGNAGNGGLLIIIAFGAYSYLLSMVNLNASMITSFNYTKGLAALGWIEAIIKLTASIVLVKYFGIAGAAIGMFLGSLLSVSWMAPLWLVKRSDNKIKYDMQFVVKHLFYVILPSVLLAVAIQFFIQSMYARFAFGILIVLVHIVLDYFIMPVDVRNFIIEHIVKTKVKILSIILRRHCDEQ
jgi:O-antigen/teichoic acid export membrane protein